MTSCFWKITLTTLIFGFPLNCSAFSPKSKKELKTAVDDCLRQSITGKYCTGRGLIGDLDVSGVSDMSGIFQDTDFNADISRWDVSSVTNMNGMFKGASFFDNDISKWNVANVVDMAEMFKGATSFGRGYLFRRAISKWDVSHVVNMRGMFSSAHNFEDDISKWDVSRVTDMSMMFNSARRFNADVSHWDVSRVTVMSSMFMKARAFTRKLCGTAWVLSKAKKDDIFESSSGSISTVVCAKPSPTTTAKTATIKVTDWFDKFKNERITTPSSSNKNDWMGPVAGVGAVMCILIPIIVLVVYLVAKKKCKIQCDTTLPVVVSRPPQANRPKRKKKQNKPKQNKKKRNKKKGSSDSSSSSSSSSDSSSDEEAHAAAKEKKDLAKEFEFRVPV